MLAAISTPVCFFGTVLVVGSLCPNFELIVPVNGFMNVVVAFIFAMSCSSCDIGCVCSSFVLFSLFILFSVFVVFVSSRLFSVVSFISAPPIAPSLLFYFFNSFILLSMFVFKFVYILIKFLFQFY